MGNETKFTASEKEVIKAALKKVDNFEDLKRSILDKLEAGPDDLSDPTSGWVYTLPAGVDLTPKLRRGDKVLVRDSEYESWERAYYARYAPEKLDEYPHVCFYGGGDEWTSEGDTVEWKYCKKWEGDE